MDSESNPNRSEIASQGGRARADALPASRRSEIAREASLVRWGADLPFATHDGDLEIAGRRIACAVLNTRKRVLTQQTFLTAVGRAAKAKAGKGSRGMQVDDLPPFLAAANLHDFISDELRQSTTPIVYRTKSGGKAFGYDAMLLPHVCEVYLKARDAHLEAKNQDPPGSVLLPSQEHIVKACDMLMRGLAKVGIIALVDQATGYAEQQTKDEMFKILEQYISPTLLPWTKTFPDEFFKQVYHIYKWDYRPGNNKRPQCVGAFINKYIYDQLPPGVLDKLREINPVLPAGYRKEQHWRHLTADTGNEHLDRQITAVQTLLQISDDKKSFDAVFSRIARKGSAAALAEGERKALVIQVDAPKNEPNLFTQAERKAAAEQVDDPT